MKPERTVVHIGSDKTGSTALQHTLAGSRTKLMERAILYPDLDGRPDHRRLANGDRSPIDVPSGTKTIILSSEALWPLPRKEIDRVLQVVPTDALDVLAYVREPGAYAEAAFLQRCRMCTSERQLRAALALLTIPPRLNPIARRAIRRFAQLSRWAEAAEGPAVDRLLLRPYLPDRWTGMDIVSDFCLATDLPEVQPVLTHRQNPIQNPTPALKVIHAAVLIRATAGPETQSRFLELWRDGALDSDSTADTADTAGSAGSDRTAGGPVIGSAIRKHVRRAVLPRLAELDSRHGGLEPLLNNAHSTHQTISESPPPRLNRAAAEELVDRFTKLTGEGHSR